jgi:hypothetical protein
VALPEELRRFERVDRTVDAVGSGGFTVSLAVLANDEPTAVRPLHDLRVMHLPDC